MKSRRIVLALLAAVGLHGNSALGQELTANLLRTSAVEPSIVAENVAPFTHALLEQDPLSASAGEDVDVCKCELPDCPVCAAKPKPEECKPPGAKPKPKKANPCATSHKDLFFNNDFSYLSKPDYSGCCLGDAFKQLSLGDCGQWGTMDFGGQFRSRFHHEYGMGQSPGVTRFQGNTNNFLLSRLRLYNDWHMNDWARVYVEGIYAGVTAEDSYVARPIDNNFGDFLNVFFDAKLTDQLTLRTGRQELLYGSQRLVSPLDWGNTRRSFEGINVLHRTENLATDIFYTHFVPVLPNDLDEADYDQPFYGFYSSYSGFKSATFDMYYLGYDSETVGAPINTDFSLHTLGVRLNGNRNGWLYEAEGGPQFGRQSGLGVDHTAGFATVGIGRKLKSVPWDATWWFYYDYASGNAAPGGFNRFNQLFPLAHKYLGFIDAAQRSNIQSPNVLLTLKPAEKVNFLFWFYHIFADQDTDIVPAIGGTPAQSVTSRNYGEELDLIMNYNLSPRSSLLFGYSHFWAGTKIIAPNVSDADFFYTQWQTNF